MGCWGMGIMQSDEYSEVYDRFLGEYDEGKPVSQISREILDEYLEEFDPDDAVMHELYFALGKAQWMCGGISEDLLRRITQIIESGSNLAFFRERGATGKDLKAREKNLERFLAGLRIPREKPRKRKIPPEKYVPKPEPAPLPAVQCGDILCYRHEGFYRAFTLTNKTRFMSLPSLYCYAWRKKFETLPTFEQLLKEDFVALGYLCGERFPDMDKIIHIGNYPVINELGLWQAQSICKKWRPVTCAWATEDLLFMEYPEELCITLEEALNRAGKLKTKYPD